MSKEVLAQPVDQFSIILEVLSNLKTDGLKVLFPSHEWMETIRMGSTVMYHFPIENEAGDLYDELLHIRISYPTEGALVSNYHID